MTDGGVTIQNGIAYATHDGVELAGDLYLPKDAKAAPALVAVHGGGWVQGARGAFQYWGPYLAARGMRCSRSAIGLPPKQDFPGSGAGRARGVQFVRGKAGAFGIDPARIGLIGASAGAHLAALAALGGKKFAGGYPQDAFAAADAGVKALVGVYGIYDAVAMWTNYQVQGGRDNNFQKFIGASPMENRQIYFDASPISYATLANNAIGVLLVTGTEDELVDRKAQTDPFELALKQAGFFVRPVHRARRAALLDERSDRGARELFRLSGAAAFALPRREALRAARPRLAEYPRRIYRLTFTGSSLIAIPIPLP